MKVSRIPLALATVAAVPMSAIAQSAMPKDVPAGHWAGKAIARLQARNILPAPKSGSKFEGSKPVTRYELAVLLWKLVQHFEAASRQPKGKTSVSAPVDGPKALRRLIADGYIPADSPLANPSNTTITEDQLATLLVGVIARVQEKTVPVTPDSKKSIPVERAPSGGA